jgi:hypothetical protein
MTGHYDKSDVNDNGGQLQSQGRFGKRLRQDSATRPVETGSNVEQTRDVGNGIDQAAPDRKEPPHQPPAQQRPRR